MNHSSLIYRGDFHENPTYRRPCTRQEADGCGPRGSQGQAHNLEETPAVDQKAGRDRPQRGSDGDRRRWGNSLMIHPPHEWAPANPWDYHACSRQDPVRTAEAPHDDL